MDKTKVLENLTMMRDLYVAKNLDYGDSFNKSLQQYGYTAAMCRIGDKMNRIERLEGAEDKAQVNESLVDTYKDAATYCMMLVGFIDSQDNSIIKSTLETLSEEETKWPTLSGFEATVRTFDEMAEYIKALEELEPTTPEEAVSYFRLVETLVSQNLATTSLVKRLCIQCATMFILLASRN